MDDDHKFHPRPQFSRSFARLVHFQFRPMRQNILCPLVQVQNQQCAILPNACPNNAPDGQFYAKAVCYIGIITPPYNILLPNKLV